MDDASTPIEDGTVEWTPERSPFVPLAELTIPPQRLDDAAGEALAKQLDLARFNPWNTPAEIRPIGSLMRARNLVYQASQALRA